MKHVASACFVSLIAALASAQTATVHVTHNHAGPFVVPGQTIRVTARITWTPFMQWAGLKGELLTTGDAGAAANGGSELIPGIIVHLGAPVGGSVKGLDIASIPGFFTATTPFPFGNWTGVNFLWFDWTAPFVITPTTIDFDFVGHPIAPNVRLYPTVISPAFVEAQTTYIGTSIIVLPAPAGIGALAAAGCIATRRRRANGV